MLSVLSKEGSVSLLPLFPIYVLVSTPKDFEEKKLRNWTAAYSTLGLLVLAVAIFLYRSVILEDLVLHQARPDKFFYENPLLDKSLAERIVPGLKILGDYFKLLILPLNLSSDYSIGESDFLSAVYSAEGVVSIVLVALLLIILFLVRKSPLAFFGLLSLLPFAITSNILFPIGTLMGERLAYLPSVGFCALFVGLVHQASARYNFKYLIDKKVLSIWLLCYVALSFNRMPVWQNNFSLFSQTVIDAPLSPKAKLNFGMELYNQKKFKEAEFYFKEAIFLDPTRLLPYKHIINIMTARGDYKDAHLWTSKALKQFPTNKTIMDVHLKLEEILDVNLKDTSQTENPSDS